MFEIEQNLNRGITPRPTEAQGVVWLGVFLHTT